MLRTVEPSNATIDVEAGPILVLSSATVLVPTTKSPLLPRLTGVPSRVIPGPPALTVVPLIENPNGFAVKLWPATTNAVVTGTSFVVIEAAGLDAGVAKAYVDDPTTRPPETSERTEPEEVIAGPGRESVELPTMAEPPGRGVKGTFPAHRAPGAAICPATAPAVASATVDAPTTKAPDEASE